MSCVDFISIMVLHGILVAGLKTRMCSESLATVRLVDQCPFNEAEWRKREFTLMCNEIQQNCSNLEFRYHCIRDSFGKLIELCAPSTVLKGKKCPEFNYGGARIQEDYTKTGYCESCPFSYSSNEVFNYSKCLKSSHNDGTTMNSKEQTEEESNETHTIWVIVACSIAVLFLVFLSVLVRMWYMRNQAHQKNMDNGKMEQVTDNSELKKLDVNKKGKDFAVDGAIVDVENPTESKGLLKIFKLDDKHLTQPSNDEGNFRTMSNTFYKGKFSKKTGNDDEDP